MNESASSEQAGATIIQATKDDVERILPLFLAYGAFYGATYPPERARAYLAEGIASGESVILLAQREREGQAGGPAAVGFAQLHPSRTSARLTRRWIVNDLFVAPEARRAGVARRLLLAARDFAIATGAGDLTLQTSQNNYAARALYESLGWELNVGSVTYRLRV